MAQTNAGSKGTLDTSYVSAMDLNVPQKYMTEVYRTFGDYGQWYLLLKSIGFDNPKKAQSYGHFEKNRQFRKIKVASTTPADGELSASKYATQAIVVNTDDLNTSALSYSNYYQVGMSVMFNDVAGFISAVTGDGTNTVTVTIKKNKLDSSTAWDALTAGDEVSIYSGVSTAEGSKMPLGERPSFDYFAFNMTQKKHVANATDVSLATETYIDSFNNAGEYQGIYSEAIKDIDNAFLRDRMGSFFFGDSITAGRLTDSTALGGTRSANETLGLFPQTAAYGHTENYTIGSWDLSELDSYILDLAADNVSSVTPLAFYQGIDLNLEWANAISTTLKYTAVDYTDWIAQTVFGGNKALATHFNFSTFERQGYKFLSMPVPAFSQPDFVGVSGAYWKNRGLIIPLDKNMDPKSLDPSTQIPSCGLTYLAMGKYNLRMQIGKKQGTGALLPGEQPNWDYSGRQYEGVMNYGTQFFGLKRNIYVKNS